MPPAVEIINLFKSFGSTRALKGINLKLREKEIYGLLGPNGAGKTTLIRLMTGLLVPDRGKVLLKGRDIQKEPREAKKKFAFIPDRPFIYQKLTGREFMQFIAKLYEINFSGGAGSIDEHLDRMGLSGVAHQLIDSYSHGMKQRLLFASLAMRSPEIIILDEPMVGLDPQAVLTVRNMLKSLADAGSAIFLSTHTLSDAQKLCGVISIIDRGGIAASGSIKELDRIASQIRGRKSEDGISKNLEEIYLSITSGG